MRTTGLDSDRLVEAWNYVESLGRQQSLLVTDVIIPSLDLVIARETARVHDLDQVLRSAVRQLNAPSPLLPPRIPRHEPEAGPRGSVPGEQP